MLPQKSSIPLRHKILNFIWSFFNMFIFPLTFRSNKLRCVILNCFGAKINLNARVSRKCRIEYPFNISLGNNSSIGDNCYLLALDKINIGDNVCISDKSSILTGSHFIQSKNFELVTSPVKIFNNVWLCYDCCILPGVTINDGAVVGSKALVSKDVERLTVVGGNPAKFIKNRNLRL